MKSQPSRPDARRSVLKTLRRLGVTVEQDTTAAEVEVGQLRLDSGQVRAAWTRKKGYIQAVERRHTTRVPCRRSARCPGQGDDLHDGG